MKILVTNNICYANPGEELAYLCVDGTAKGGMLVAMSVEFGIPISYIGFGEATEDLQVFDSRAFSRALVGLKA